MVYLASATSTWIDGRKTKVYSTDAPQGTIFVAENNSPLETVQENGATCYLVDTSRQHNTNLNSNGSEYYGTFKVCLPVDNVPTEGSFTIKATGGVAQYNLFLAYNPAASEQSYIISDPGYTTLEAQIPFKWSGTEETDTASLQVIKAGAGGAPLEGAEFTLTGSGGTTVSGTTDRNGQIVWRDLPADEKYTLTETAAPEGYQIMAPMNVTLTPGRTEYVTVTDDVERGFTIKKVDAQNKGSLQGAVFRFEQIDGSYMTTGITGFDGTISFEGDELPYHPQNSVIYVRQGLDAPTIFRGVAQELARAHMDKGGIACESPDFTAYSVSYMLCKRNGVSVEGFSFDRLPESYAMMDAKALRAEAGVMRDVAGTITADMNRLFAAQEKAQKNRDSGARYPGRDRGGLDRPEPQYDVVH